MTENRTRFITLGQARTMLDVARKKHDGDPPLPPEILHTRRQIDEGIREAELFLARTGAVDNAMVYRVVDLKLLLDRQYLDWMESFAA